MIDKTCAYCSTTFQVHPCRSDTAKYCSKACSNSAAVKPSNAVCKVCATPFRLKPSQLERYGRTLGVFCSVACATEAKRKGYEGERNPNYKGRNTDSDGYRIFPPSAKREHGVQVGKLHQAVACKALGLARVPRGFHVHHRDCDILHNTKANLAVLTISDHKWLHHQFGVATLWALMHNKVELESLLRWSDDKTRARRLLTLSVSEPDVQTQYIDCEIDLFK